MYLYTHTTYIMMRIYIIIYCMINYMWKNALSYIIIYTYNYIWVYKGVPRYIQSDPQGRETYRLISFDHTPTILYLSICCFEDEHPAIPILVTRRSMAIQEANTTKGNPRSRDPSCPAAHTSDSCSCPRL